MVLSWFTAVAAATKTHEARATSEAWSEAQAGRVRFWRRPHESGEKLAVGGVGGALSAHTDGAKTIENYVRECKPLPPRPAPAANVRSLRPQDIRGVIALGDSITAGFGLRGGFEEYRGASWCIGGDAGELTVPNLLNTVLPTGSSPVVGASLGVHLPEICIGEDYCPPGQRRRSDILNAAQSGAMAKNMIGQAEFLVETVPKMADLDLKNDWKLATLMIGANDLCDVCSESESKRESHAKEYEASIRQALETLRAGIPKLLVNLVAIFDVSEVYEVGEHDPHCIDRRKISRYECECALNPSKKNPQNRALMDDYAGIFRDISSRIAADYRDAEYDGFGVALHKFGFRTNFTEWPEDFVSPLDCFHPSIYAHRTLAVALWNSMLTPLEERKETFDLNSEPICPDENSRIYL